MASRGILDTRQRNRVEDFTDRWRKGGYSLMTTPPGMGVHLGPDRNKNSRPIVVFLTFVMNA